MLRRRLGLCLSPAVWAGCFWARTRRNRPNAQPYNNEKQEKSERIVFSCLFLLLLVLVFLKMALRRLPEPERFPIGLRVLALDIDSTHHPILQAMGNQFQYQVTTCCMPSFALNLLSQTKCSFDVIIVDTDTQELIAYNFLEHVLLVYQIPVIIMSSDYSTNTVMKAITKGASDYWIKPLEEQEFKYFWKHVVKRVINNENKHENMNITFNKKRGREEDKVNVHNDNYPQPAKKFRMSWTQQLHNQFVTVVNQLGLEKAKPKQILKIMDVPGLTREHIASHLQKLKNKLEKGMQKRGRKKSNSSVVSSSAEMHLVLEAIHTLQEQEQVQSDQISGRQQHLKEFCDYDPSDIFYDLPEDLSSLIFEACPPTEVDIFSR